MPIRELKEKYGRSRGAINRAIRDELAGGNELLDALELFHKIVLRLGEYEDDGKTPTVAQVAHDRLCGIANAMEAEIRRRYGMPPNE
jgi:hypothetical protein